MSQQHLERHLPAVPETASEVAQPHPAPADLSLDGASVGQDLPEREEAGP